VHLKTGGTRLFKADAVEAYARLHPGTGAGADTIHDASIIFTKVEVEAEYPGGKQAWIQYLTQNLKYPLPAVAKKIQGTVVVQFIVNQDGSISNIQAISVPEELRDETVRIIRKSGKWSPARQNGKTVKAYKKQPVSYKLSV
jgi:protein TonB